MKKIVFVILVMCISLCSVVGQVFAIDGEINQYEIYNDNGDMLAFSSEVEVGDKILTKDFYEYEVYAKEGTYCKARLIRMVEEPSLKALPQKMTTKRKVLGLYMTHNDESYLPSDGYDSIYGAGGIHDVANLLKSELAKKKIEVTLDETLHIPHNSSAYSRSGLTAKSLMSNEKPDALFDIHRDGVSKKYYETSYKGEEHSKIRIVVGKGNSNFEKNYEFAQKVFKIGNEKYPWLFLDIYSGKGHYNQNLKDTNLLFEMGTYLIEKEAVYKSVPYLADVIDSALYEMEVIEEEVIEQDKEESPSIEQAKYKKSNLGLIVFIIILSTGIVVAGGFLFIKAGKK